MAKIDEVTPAAAPVTSVKEGYAPEAATIGFSDLIYALKEGARDFGAAPVYGILIGSFYVLVGNFIIYALIVNKSFWMVVPAIVAFPMIGPFIATGFYEISRKRSLGQSWKMRDVFFKILQQRNGQIAYVGVAMLCITWIWVFFARILFAILLGAHSFLDLWDFLHACFTTSNGLTFIGIGSAFGLVMAYVLYCSTVVTIPILVGRDVDIMTAIIASWKAVRKNWAVMMIWAGIIIALMASAMIPALLGLIIILPVLGHATWHVYSRIIKPQ